MSKQGKKSLLVCYASRLPSTNDLGSWLHIDDTVEIFSVLMARHLADSGVDKLVFQAVEDRMHMDLDFTPGSVQCDLSMALGCRDSGKE